MGWSRGRAFYRKTWGGGVYAWGLLVVAVPRAALPATPAAAMTVAAQRVEAAGAAAVVMVVVLVKIARACKRMWRQVGEDAAGVLAAGTPSVLDLAAVAQIETAAAMAAAAAAAALVLWSALLTRRRWAVQRWSRCVAHQRCSRQTSRTQGDWQPLLLQAWATRKLLPETSAQRLLLAGRWLSEGQGNTRGSPLGMSLTLMTSSVRRRPWRHFFQMTWIR